MSHRLVLVLSTASVSAATALLPGCGGDDAERPVGAYVRLSDGDGAKQVDRRWYLDGPKATFGWVAHGPAEDGVPTTLRITRLTGPCEAAKGEPCPEDSDLVRSEPEDIELPADGAERSGTIAVGDLQNGARTRVSVKLCREDACWSSAMREFRRE